MKFFRIRHSIVWLLVFLCSHICAQDELNPVADPAAVVVSGNARFTVLTSKMIRIEYSSTGQFEDRATFAIVNRRLPVPSYPILPRSPTVIFIFVRLMLHSGIR